MRVTKLLLLQQIDSTGAIDSLLADVAGAYKYELKGTSSLEETITASADNGTVFYEQALNLTLPKLSATDTKEIKLLAASRPQIIVQDYNNNYMVVGLENGADVSGGTIVTGTAMGDMSGYTLVFSGMETAPASHIEVYDDSGLLLQLVQIWRNHYIFLILRISLNLKGATLCCPFFIANKPLFLYYLIV